MFFFVNGRWVKDKVIRYGILRGYHSHLLKGRYPCVLFFLTLSPELVDVNVHPSKTELRFQYADDVQGEIARAIRECLRSEAWAGAKEGFATVREQSLEKTLEEPSKKISQENWMRPASQKSLSYNSSMIKPSSSVSYSSPRWSPGFSSQKETREEKLQVEDNSSFESSPVLEKLTEEVSLDSVPRQEESWFDWQHAVYKGTLFKCYLIFELGEKSLFVDQHAFHERILYEKLCTDNSLLESAQPLMIPEVLSFEPTTIASLLERQEELSKASFLFEKISEEEIEVSSIPSLLVNRNLRDVFYELAQKKEAGSPKELHHLLLATIACHSAVRAGEELSLDKITQLTNEAGTVDFSANCPHGRRVFKWFHNKDIAKWFDLMSILGKKCHILLLLNRLLVVSHHWPWVWRGN